MKFDNSIFLRLPVTGRGQTIVIYDSAVKGEFRPMQDVPPHEHASRISGFVVNKRLGPVAADARLYSVSYMDCLNDGFDAVKRGLVSKLGPIQIEAHAYSCPASDLTDHYERQIHQLQKENGLRSLMLCSPGHDLFRTRFPATSKYAVSVGLLTDDGNIVGAGPAGLSCPSLLVRDHDYPCENEQSSVGAVRGTSPAVVFAAALAALISEHLGAVADTLELYAGLLLLSEEYGDSYLLCAFDLLEKRLSSFRLAVVPAKKRSLLLRVRRNSSDTVKMSMVVEPARAGSALAHERIEIQTSHPHGSPATRADHRALLSFDWLEPGQYQDLSIEIEGLSDSVAFACTGVEVEILNDSHRLRKEQHELAIIGISASHDASAILTVGNKVVSGIQLERITRLKHDGQSCLTTDAAVRYCLEAAGLNASDIDIFSFNAQALTPGYVGLSQPLSLPGFTLFDPFGPKSLYTSHHLCHAFAGYSGSTYEQGVVVVADGSGGVTVGADDLILTGPQLKAYLAAGNSGGDLDLHTFSVYDFSCNGFTLRHREYSRSFNVRSGSNSLGETYAAVSQYVFGSWQDSGKLMGLAPYGKPGGPSLLCRSENGTLNFDHLWKISVQPEIGRVDLLRHADLAARVQQDLELALVDRFKKHVGKGKDVVFSGGIALNSVANHVIKKEIHAHRFYLLPAQHDAGIALGAAAVAAFHKTGKISSLTVNGL